MNVIVEFLRQTPRDTSVSDTSLVILGTLHENSGGCDGHVWLTEQETETVEPAFTSAGTVLITGLSGEAEDGKHKGVL